MADLFGWPPRVVNHLSITELLFWLTRNGEGRDRGEVPPHARSLY